MGRLYQQLSYEERTSIARLRADGRSIRHIAATLDRAASTISREIARNSGEQIGYQPGYADDHAWARRWRGSRLARQPDLRALVLDRLAMGWSPEQVAGRLALEQGSTVISHESIYRFIHAQIRRTNDGAWRHYLPRARAKRGRFARSRLPLNTIVDRVSVRERPSRVERRLEYGHWEADLLHPRKSGPALLVAQERKTRFVLIAKVPGKHAKPVAARLTQWLAGLPRPLARSVTQDNGPEFYLHNVLNPLGIETYFCDAHSP